MRFNKAVLYTVLALALGTDAKLFGKEKCELSWWRSPGVPSGGWSHVFKECI